jgi:hypothetical protein
MRLRRCNASRYRRIRISRESVTRTRAERRVRRRRRSPSVRASITRTLRSHRLTRAPSLSLFPPLLQAIKIGASILNGTGEEVTVSYSGLASTYPGNIDWIGVYSPKPDNFSTVTPIKYKVSESDNAVLSMRGMLDYCACTRMR